MSTIASENKFLITNFFRCEQPLINQLREEGKYVYGLRDGSGNSYSIANRVIVNNIGFMITNFPIPLDEYDGCIDSKDFFERFNPIEEPLLRTTQKDL